MVHLDRTGAARTGLARDLGTPCASARAHARGARLSVQLAGRLDPDLPEETQGHTPASLAASVQAVRYPAYGLDRLWNACAWNAAAARLFVGWLDADHQRNLLRFVFLQESARVLIPDWRERARRLLAEFRADFGHTFRDAQVKAFIDRLKAAAPACVSLPAAINSRAWATLCAVSFGGLPT